MDSKLATKIYNVMCATESLKKDLTVGKAGSSSAYEAVGEKTVLNMVKPLFKEQKLIILPADGSISENILEYVDTYSKNKLRAITQLKVYFDIIDAETGESTRIVGFGNGADSQDKGSGKAFTYALKTALQKSFLMFSGEDTDNTHSNDMGNVGSPLKPTNLDCNELIIIGGKKGYSASKIEKALIKKYGHGMQYITEAERAEMISGFKSLDDK